MQAGQVRVLASPETFDRGLTLAAGAERFPFAPVSDTEDGWPSSRTLFTFDETCLLSRAILAPPNSEADPEAFCEAKLNALPDWALVNGQTLQLRVLDRALPVELVIRARAVLPPRRSVRWFRVSLAVHRGEAEFCLNMTSSKTGKTTQSVVAFDTDKAGGQIRSGYQEIALEVPPADHETVLTMSVRYLSYRQTAEDNEPYLFIADPMVTRQINGTPALSARQIPGETVADARWYQAGTATPILADSAPLELVAGKARRPIFTPRKATVRIVEDHGHTLMLLADQPGQYVFFIDGVPAFTAFVGSAATPVRFPLAYLDGHQHHVTLRDVAGMQVFLETVLLMPRTLTPTDVLQRESTAPFPGALAPQADHRYAGLKAHLAHPADAKTQAQIGYALGVLEGGHDQVKLRPLVFPKVGKPDVSIVIPAHNKVEVTYLALCALLVARNEASFEVIVVDDGSTDETAKLEEIVSGITVIHNASPQRFIRSCNAGVAKARGRYVVLLNNDTEPTVGWLDALIDAFGRFPNVGLAGAKLLYPNGQLQDAGGIIWGSGNPWNYGNRANPWEPRFRYARQADYLSGAALMTTKAIWDEVGGLSSYLEPMYFEDTDFAFKVREAGYATWFVPSSVVYHYEGMTSGTDVTSGYKKFQEVNRPKFKRRWAKAYTGFGPEGVQPDLEKDRGIVGRVLFIDYSTPRPDRDAGSYAALQEMKLVQSLGYKVTFLPQNLAYLGSYTDALERNGIEVVVAPFYLSIQEFLQNRGAEFDAVYITRYYVGQQTIGMVRAMAPRAKIIFNNADLHFLRELRTALAAGDAERVEAARAMRIEELDVMRKCDVVLSYNEVEHSVIQSHTEGAVTVKTCPWVVEVPENVPGLEGRQGLSFLGSFLHFPNAEGIEWFAGSVMPLLNAERSSAPIKLTIYGAQMGDEVRDLASDVIDPVGFIEDVAEAYDRHRVFIAPLVSGAGIKGKVLGALAHGIPCVLSPIAAEGIGLRHGQDCMIASTPQEWTEAITALEGDDALWQSVSEAGRAYVSERFSFAKGREKMRAAFEAVDIFLSVD